MKILTFKKLTSKLNNEEKTIYLRKKYILNFEFQCLFSHRERLNFMLKKSIIPVNDNFTELSNFAIPILVDYFDKYFDKYIKPGIIQDWFNHVLSPKKIENDILNGMNYYYVLVDQKKAGYIAFRPEKDELFLSKFYVEKNARKNGLGRYAMDFVEEYGKSKNLKNVFCYVADYNEPSLAAYRKLGFTERGIFHFRETFKGDEIYEREFIMAKPIKPIIKCE
ncbi:hypothetical protein TRFO_28578 [Tritrichomonas foetus]|uniref:N-acetyltransferase domain-containing protein n=1 Tax=Tritrichomonas foetus TaxID=1144522 RepID=A0A1J4K2L5_9EUKA|nr:hypothetical protein TRFO_28578 [Tritrichomonas foetus]|eukprot:OHT03988.1 hypothetical protein TRFO_28578 [Tritrichomonas foetus]